MARIKFDGLIEAVRYTPEGEIDQVRLYERRGPTFSDHVLMDREALLAFMTSGKKVVTGTRQLLMASTFNVDKKVHAVKASNGRMVISTQKTASQDKLEGTLIF